MILSIKNNISHYLYLPILMAAFIAGNAVLDLCVVLSSLYWLIYKRKNIGKYPSLFKKIIFIFIIFYISILFSSFFSEYLDYSLKKSFVFLDTLYLHYFYLIFLYLKLKIIKIL